jgi:hypothetical protein
VTTATKETQDKRAVIRNLCQIPSVGKAVAEDLWNLGIRSVAALKDEDPEALYQRLCTLQGISVDRCMLYTFRCAVYYASNSEHDPKLLQWWNWKDKPPTL